MTDLDINHAANDVDLADGRPALFRRDGQEHWEPESSLKVPQLGETPVVETGADCGADQRPASTMPFRKDVSGRTLNAMTWWS